jgi:hypothetical protein
MAPKSEQTASVCFSDDVTVSWWKQFYLLFAPSLDTFQISLREDGFQMCDAVEFVDLADKGIPQAGPWPSGSWGTWNRTSIDLTKYIPFPRWN